MRKYEQQANGNARQGQQQRRGPSEKPEGCTSVFIGNLSWNIDEDTIRQAFASCGEVCRVPVCARATSIDPPSYPTPSLTIPPSSTDYR